MGLLGTRTQESYYNQSQSKWSTNPNGVITTFTLTDVYFPTLTSLAKTDIRVFINGVEIDTVNYDYVTASSVLTFSGRTGNETVLLETTFAPIDGATLTVKERAAKENYGNYQYVSIRDIVNNFLISYVGEDKIIPKVRKADISFHAQRGLAELSYDILRSEKSQEIEIPPSLTMILPHDYINYIKLTWLDGSGLERMLYPQRKTSNPTTLLQDDDGNYLFDDTDGELLKGIPSDTWNKYKDRSGVTASNASRVDDDTDIDWRYNQGQRYGIEPEFAQENGFFFIDPVDGKIFFSSNMNGKTVTLKYISDTLGTEDEQQVHKLAEEALYKYIAYALLSTRINVPEYMVRRFKKERFAEMRKAKIRLSNLKSEELAQVMKGKSKFIK